MRNEKEIIDLILRFAHADDNIRAVVMNGSRVNPNAKKDPFQDYDIACLVRDVTPYQQNMSIPPFFGEMLVMQTPDDMGDAPTGNNDHYIFLMQFMDGNRIDLSFHSLAVMEEIISDSLSLVLLDKDGLVRPLPQPSDVDYFPKPPTAKQFFDCCNEFWWVTPYVAKGLWRDELTYAKCHLEIYLREKLLEMLAWYFGVRTGFQKAPGKMGKYLKGGLEPELWALLERTYADAAPEHTWDALLAMGELFRVTGRRVAAEFGHNYPEQDDRRVTDFIREIRRLPRDAQTFENRE